MKPTFDLAGRIDSLRLRTNMSLQDLSEKIQITTSGLHLIKNRNDTKLSTIQLICNAFNIGLVDFFTEDEPVERVNQVNDLQGKLVYCQTKVMLLQEDLINTKTQLLEAREKLANCK